MKLSLSMSHSISIRLGHSVIPEADTFSQLRILSIFLCSFFSLSSVSFVSEIVCMETDERHDSRWWLVGRLHHHYHRQRCDGRLLPLLGKTAPTSSPLVASSTAILRNRCDFLFSLLNRVRRFIIHFPMMWYKRLTYVSHGLRWWPTFFFSNTNFIGFVTNYYSALRRPRSRDGLSASRQMSNTKHDTRNQSQFSLGTLFQMHATSFFIIYRWQKRNKRVFTNSILKNICFLFSCSPYFSVLLCASRSICPP